MDHDELERRKRPRATGIVGSARVFARGEWSDAWTVRDLSAGGAMLVGSLRLPLNERIEILFDADGDRLTGIGLHAEVRRSEILLDKRHAIGVAFRDVPAAIHDHIQELVSSALERKRAAATATILVVDGTPEARRAVARDLGQSRKVVGASTLLDIIRHLHDPDLRIEAALVNARVGPADGLAILAHLAEAHPTVRRILMSDRARVRDYELVLVSGAAHAFLTKPWERECLVAALSAPD